MKEKIELILKEADLRITPQRMVVLDAIMQLNSHPAMDEIIEAVQREHTHIATGTIYRVVELLHEKGVIGKVKTRTGSMRIDAVNTHHHHLVNQNETRIEDYHDAELDEVLKSYFTQKGIENFDIERISVEIQGSFRNEKNK